MIYVSLMVISKENCDTYTEDKEKGIKAETIKNYQITKEHSKIPPHSY